jgi:uncharacterized protein YcgI (DUF1989 family)
VAVAGQREIAGAHTPSEKHPKYVLDKTFYDRVRAAQDKFTPVGRLRVPPRSGVGFTLKKGHAVRFITPDGPQIGDVALWHVDNKKEFFSATLTWVVEGFVIRPDVRLWSNVPYFRPMATCLRDTVEPRPRNSKFHHHDCRTHCTSELLEMKTGQPGLNSCHVNFLQAIEPFGLEEEDIHDNFMVHQKTYVDPKGGRVYVMRGDSKPLDFIEFYAEIDLLVALSVCPSGDGSAWPGKVHRPLEVEIYDTGIAPMDFPRWTDWRPGWKGRWQAPNKGARTGRVGSSG